MLLNKQRRHLVVLQLLVLDSVGRATVQFRACELAVVQGVFVEKGNCLHKDCACVEFCERSKVAVFCVEVSEESCVVRCPLPFALGDSLHLSAAISKGVFMDDVRAVGGFFVAGSEP